MFYKLRVNGSSLHYNVDMIIYTDSLERVDKIKKFAENNNFQFYSEVLSL